MTDEELKIEKSKVLQAAKDCPTAAVVLRTLFPTAFTKEINLLKLKCNGVAPGVPLFTEQSAREAFGEGAPEISNIMQIRSYGRYKAKAFWLSTLYLNWELKFEDGEQILVPTVK